MNSRLTKAVTVFAGRRDGYQLPWALGEQGLLEAHVADVYGGGALRHLPFLKPGLRACKGLPSSRVEWSAATAALTALCLSSRKLNRKLIPVRDRILSLRAAELAIERDAVYFPYSYYAGDGIARYGRSTRANLIFQVHPHGDFLRACYAADMEREPAGRPSLLREEEHSQVSEFQALIEQAPLSAHGMMCASTFTKRSLVHAGVRCPIAVVPYGVDADKFQARLAPPSNRRLTLSFVGQISQRKGFVHLLNGMARSGCDVHLDIISRGSVPAEFQPFLDRVSHTLHRGLDDGATWDLVRKSDLFALPSVAEGFGLVILEAMACGVPVMTTTATGGADVITHGVDGLVLEPGDAAAIAAELARHASDRDRCAEMGFAARRTAERCSWERFRTRVAEAYASLLSPSHMIS